MFYKWFENVSTINWQLTMIFLLPIVKCMGFQGGSYCSHLYQTNILWVSPKTVSSQFYKQNFAGRATLSQLAGEYRRHSCPVLSGLQRWGDAVVFAVDLMKVKCSSLMTHQSRHQRGAYLRVPQHKTTANIFIPPWIGCWSVPGLVPAFIRLYPGWREALWE